MGEVLEHVSPTLALTRRFSGGIDYDEPSQVIPIGVVVPFDFELDWEYWRYLPPGVELSFTRTPYLRQPVGMRLARDVGKPSVVARATKALSSINPAVTLYACSSGSFINGLEGEAAIRQAMLDVGARRAVTSSGALLQALQATGARRVAVATPYTSNVTARLVAFLEEAGFEVTSALHLSLTSRISRVSPATVAELIRQASDPAADVVFVSCTALRTFGIIAELEDEIGLPILTSNQVSLWATLYAADILPEAVGQDDWVLGGGHPMSRSTAGLLRAVGTSPTDWADSVS